MKIILTQEVTGLGAPGDVVEVKDGYGRNYLVPRGVAIRWTHGAEKTVESIRTARSTRAVRDLDHAAEIKAKLEAEPVTSRSVPARAVACSAPSPPPRSPRRSPSVRRGGRQAHHRVGTRSSRSAPTRCRSSCTTRCPPRWPSTSSPPDQLTDARVVTLRGPFLLREGRPSLLLRGGRLSPTERARRVDTEPACPGSLEPQDLDRAH